MAESIYAKSEGPTLYFIGVTTGKSSIMKVFPRWAEALGLDGARIEGMDFPPHADAQAYMAAVRHIQADELTLGALVTTHKIDLLDACRELFDELDPYARLILFCVGGGSKNALWNQIKADVLRLPLVLSDQPEAGLQGAALLGAAGVGLVDDLAGSAHRRLVPKETVNPNAEVSQRYRACLAEFSRIYDHQLGFWQRTDVPPPPPSDCA